MPLYTQDDVTVLIAARNAQETICRAVASVRAQSSCPIVLVDDFSEDDTVNLARLEGGSGLTVVRPPYHGALGFTRQCGLNVIQTPFTLLLDADDAFLPARIARFTAQMNDQPSELWADELLLFDGSSNALIRHIAIPDFIASAPVPYRLFERNYLPGVGQVGYRTELAKAVGYDPELHGPEDIDLVLRMMLQGARFAYDGQAGYAMYAYPTSVSRNLERQKTMYARSLARFQEQVVERFYIRHGASRRQVFIGILLMLIHQTKYEEALSMLLRAEDTGAEAKEVPNESQKPHEDEIWEWRLRFYRGSLHLKAGQPDLAVQALNEAMTIRVSPDTLNNLGCALKELKRINEANQCFIKALQFKPHYLDAKENLSNSNNMFITLPEMRILVSRDHY
jgi:glycosyltransferase involved in cell wall biosynthesis